MQLLAASATDWFSDNTWNAIIQGIVGCFLAWLAYRERMNTIDRGEIKTQINSIEKQTNSLTANLVQKTEALGAANTKEAVTQGRANTDAAIAAGAANTSAAVAQGRADTKDAYQQSQADKPTQPG